MNKASLQFVVLFFAILFVSLQAHAQQREPRGDRPRDERPQNERGPHDERRPQQPLPRYEEPRFPQPQPRGQQQFITERVQHSLFMYQSLRIADLLRLSYEAQDFQVTTLSLLAMSSRGNGQGIVEVLSHGRVIQSVVIRRHLNEVSILLPAMVSLSGLEIRGNEEMYIESISAQVERQHQMPLPQERLPAPNSLITVQIHQDFWAGGEVAIKRLVKEQLGLSLEGAQIQRVVVEAAPTRMGQAASVQVEMNNRLIGPVKYISGAQRRIPFPLNSYKEVRTLRLVVHGSARIETISIRIGQVRRY